MEDGAHMYVFIFCSSDILPSHFTLMTGRSPNVEKLNLAAAGVSVDGTKGHILADEWQVT